METSKQEELAHAQCDMYRCMGGKKSAINLQALMNLAISKVGGLEQF
jgi:hypothetical protein